MRITVCVKHDLFGALALNHLLPALTGHRVQLVFGEKTRQGEDSVPELMLTRLLDRVVPLTAVFPALETRSAPPPGSLLTFAEMARRLDCAGEVVRDLRPDGGARLFHAFAPDLILSIRFSLIFPAALINLPRHGVLNVHPGRLPEYGGLFAPFRQMLRGERDLGCTLHWVDEGIDTGPILSVEPVRAASGRTMMWHAARLYEAGVARTAGIVRNIAEGHRPVATVQDPTRRVYYRYPSTEEFKAFAARGHHLASRRDYGELLRLFDPGIDLDDMLRRADVTDLREFPGWADGADADGSDAERRPAVRRSVPC